jgi:hypothetical protein
MRIQTQLLISLTIISVLITTQITQEAIKAQHETPTTAPTKTPSTEPQPSITSTNTTIQTQIADPFTQRDLSVLTGNIQRPNGLFWFENKLYTSCTGDWTLYEINIESRETVQYIFGIRNAHSMYVERDEITNEVSLWIPDFQTNTLAHINRSGLEIATSNLNGPWGITPGNSTHFFVTNLLDHNATKVGKDGTTNHILTNLRSPTGIAADAEYTYIANTGSARRAIEWFNTQELVNTEDAIDTEKSDSAHTLVTGLQNTTNIALASDGFLYFTYALGTRGVVGRVDPNICRENGGCTHDQVEIVVYTELATPLAGLTISPDMRLFVHSMFSPDIYWVQLNSETT